MNIEKKKQCCECNKEPYAHDGYRFSIRICENCGGSGLLDNLPREKPSLLIRLGNAWREFLSIFQ